MVLKSSFTFPIDNNHEEFIQFVQDKKCLVIGVFGSTKFQNRESGKASIFNEFLQKKLFSTSSETNKVRIEGVHDKNSGIIFLDARTSCDSAILVSRTNQQKDAIEKNGFDAFFSEEKSQNTKIILFLFHICHILICYSEFPRIDLTIPVLFKTLEKIKVKFQNSILETIQEKVGESFLNFHQNSQLCTPILLFYFATCPLDLRGSKGLTHITKKDGKISKHSPIQKLEYAIEDQLYKILGQAHISFNGGNSLFILPNECVYVNNETEHCFENTVSQNLTHLYSHLECPKNPDDLINSPFPPYSYENNLTELRKQRNFSSFLSAHINNSQRNSQNVSSSSQNNSNENLLSSTWYSFSKELYNFFWIDESSQKLNTCSSLTNYTEIETKYSEMRCSKALPIAFAVYKEGLPSHYMEEQHTVKLVQAVNVFSVQARGHCVQKYAGLLWDRCRDYWVSGKQMCEVLSLTNHHCIHRKHQESSEDEKLPTMLHDSRYIIISACNCGRKQESRDDPFYLIEANHDFYKRLEADCCEDFEHWEFPFFQSHLYSKHSGPLKDTNNESLTNGIEEIENDTLGKESLADLASQKTSKRNVSYMITKGDKDLLPEFSSWSLLQLGPSYLYSHASGINQPGFLSGSKHLLPWDVPLTKISWSQLVEKWPYLAENAAKKVSLRGKGNDAEITAKVFVGCEYECPRGHRFISHSPEQRKVTISKTTSVRDAASKVVNSDMPLYIACSCSTTRSVSLGQLMRIHIVTPKAPLHVTLLPEVVPNESQHIFITGCTSPIKLPPNTYWVLRLPFLYYGFNRIYLAPMKNPTGDINNSGRLLKGFISISEDYEEK